MRNKERERERDTSLVSKVLVWKGKRERERDGVERKTGDGQQRNSGYR